MTNRFIKDPQAVLDYQWDWSAWLGDGETIASHQVIVPTGLTLDSSAATDSAVTAWLSGGEVIGRSYAVSCRITTTAGRTDARSIYINIQER